MQSDYLKSAGIDSALQAAVTELMRPDELPENPFPQLASSLARHELHYALWPAMRPASALLSVPESAGKGRGRSDEVRHAAGCFELWGLGELVRATDPAVGESHAHWALMASLAAGSEQSMDEYWVKRVVAVAGDWAYLGRLLPHPSTLQLLVEVVVTGKVREAALNLFVDHIMEDFYGLVDGRAPHPKELRPCILEGVYIEKAARNRQGEPHGEAAQAARPERWTLNRVERSKDGFIQEVKSAVVAKRQVWVEFLAVMVESDAAAAPESSASDSGRISVVSMRSSEAVEGIPRYVRCRRTYTFHYEGSDSDTESFGRHRHEASYSGLFFARQDAEFYTSLFHRLHATAYDDDAPTKIPETWRERCATEVAAAAARCDGIALCKSVLWCTLLDPSHRSGQAGSESWSSPELEALVPEIHVLLNSPAATLDALSDDFAILASVLSEAQTSIPERHKQRHTFQGSASFLGIRTRLQAALIAGTSASSDMHVHSGLIAHMDQQLSRLFDRQQMKLAVLDNTQQELLKMSVHCKVLALSMSSSLLDQGNCDTVVAAAVRYLSKSGTARDAMPQFLQRSAASNAGDVALFINVNDEAKEVTRSGSAPAGIAREAVILQYAADSGLWPGMRDLLRELTWESLPVNPFVDLVAQIRRRALAFDMSHQRDAEVVAGMFHQPAAVDASISILTDARSGSLFGATQAMSFVNAGVLLPLVHSLGPLIVDSESTYGAMEFQTTTALAGDAVLWGSVLPAESWALGCVALVQEVSVQGPSPESAGEMFSQKVFEHVKDLHKLEDIVVTLLGASGETPTTIESIAGRDFDQNLNATIAEALSFSQTIELHGFLRHEGRYLEFSKLLSFQFGPGSAPVDKTHHIRQRVWTSQASAKRWLPNGSRGESLDWPKSLAGQILEQARNNELYNAYKNLAMYCAATSSENGSDDACLAEIRRFTSSPGYMLYSLHRLLQVNIELVKQSANVAKLDKDAWLNTWDAVKRPLDTFMLSDRCLYLLGSRHAILEHLAQADTLVRDIVISSEAAQRAEAIETMLSIERWFMGVMQCSLFDCQRECTECERKLAELRAA